MGDMKEVFDDLKKYQRDKKAERMKVNMDALNESGIDYTPCNHGYQINFYVDGLPGIAFYPSTNKWLMLGKTRYGNASDFLVWLARIQEQ